MQYNIFSAHTQTVDLFVNPTCTSLHVNPTCNNMCVPYTAHCYFCPSVFRNNCLFKINMFKHDYRFDIILYIIGIWQLLPSCVCLHGMWDITICHGAQMICSFQHSQDDIKRLSITHNHIPTFIILAVTPISTVLFLRLCVERCGLSTGILLACVPFSQEFRKYT